MSIYVVKIFNNLLFISMKKPLHSFISIIVLTIGLVNCSADKPLKRELVRIWNEDQEIRNEYSEALSTLGKGSPAVDSLVKLMRVQDSAHLATISRILDEKGWVGIDRIGQIANNTFFLVIQHSDLKTQQKYLPLMRKAVKEGKTEPDLLALLEDRVALGEGRKQVYGSQVNWNQYTNQHYVAPLEDPDNVDVRRREVGLDPMAHYLKQWDLDWDADEYKKQLPQIELLLEKETH